MQWENGRLRLVDASSRVVSAVDELDQVTDSRAVAVLIVVPAHRPHTSTCSSGIDCVTRLILLRDGRMLHSKAMSPQGPSIVRHAWPVWCSGNALVLINAVALHRARLVLGWVTAFG